MQFSPTSARRFFYLLTMNEILITTDLRGFDLKFKTKPGVFSKHQIDAGTQLLINSLDIQPNDNILDLGCGYGPIGIVAAKLAPEGKTVLVDANIRAVRLTQENIRLNKIPNAKALLSDGLEAVEQQKFQVVASNPPASSGLDIFNEFLANAKKCLSASGKIYFVTQERLKPTIERQFNRFFGNYQLVNRSREYIISLAVNEL